MGPNHRIYLQAHSIKPRPNLTSIRLKPNLIHVGLLVRTGPLDADQLFIYGPDYLHIHFY